MRTLTVNSSLQRRKNQFLCTDATTATIAKWICVLSASYFDRNNPVPPYNIYTYIYICIYIYMCVYIYTKPSLIFEKGSYLPLNAIVSQSNNCPFGVNTTIKLKITASKSDNTSIQRGMFDYEVCRYCRM